MPTDDLTPGQAAAFLQVDASTLRRLAKVSPERLSPQSQARRRRYSPADLAILVTARDLLLETRSAAEVRPVLTPVPAQPPAMPALAPAQPPALVEELNEAREIVRAMLAQLDQLRQDQDTVRGELATLRATHSDQTARLTKTLDQLRAEQASERARLAADRSRLAYLVAELDAWRRLPWWRRLFEPPPGRTQPPRALPPTDSSSATG
jgi:DNA-binding transcriptional MerR regulator